MSTIEIRSSQHSYQAIVGSNLLDRAGKLIVSKTRGSRCAIVADKNVVPLFADRVTKSLASAGFQPTLITVPAGEKSKTLGQAGEICERMLAAKLDRQSFVVGLGGGMIGDLSGFVAAIFERGIPHVQIPTTLLAMVDSSIGGKTGVNTAAGKNLIGAFHHPELVIDDVDVLKTLPRREFNQGFAEIIKHAIIADAEMFAAIQPVDLAELAPLIRRNIEIKSSIVAKDERDRTGERALLNFGHTVGHAIEYAGSYQQFLHGEAISLGMVAASAISAKRAGLPKDQRDSIVDLLHSVELPVRLPPDFPREKIFEALIFDKKFENGKVRFVVSSTIGSAHLSSDITLNDIREAVAEL
ncbi:MAG TPA: 3-dehydroquinate synthase [Chthoniobacterales bacterium]|nr:3-dehydroquinate synthase [Chthoniobacterales bacterium]